ncbi:MAG: WD40 repeat domain-containing protein [Gaiellaceae bacterium]
MRDAEQRAWEVVRRAFEERQPAPRGHRASNSLLLALFAALVAGAVVAAVSPPGRAVIDRVRRTVGIEHAQPALLSLPARGRLLVVSAGGGGVWLVHDNGLLRRIGSYSDAQWSPHGMFVVATTTTSLVALDPDGGVRWSLARKDVAWPRWEGTRADTRIAYMTPGGLRVVAGDGTGDRLLDAHAAELPPAWDTGRLHTVAYFAAGAIVLRNADTGRVLWRTAVTFTPSALTWSSDGRYLAVVSKRLVVVLGADGRRLHTLSDVGGAFLGAAFRPRTHELAVSLRLAARSEVKAVEVDHPGLSRLLFAGPGDFGDIAWSPDGGWLLVAWPTANQWVFLHGSHARAVANIEQQFPRGDGQGPLLQLSERWCCS